MCHISFTEALRQRAFEAFEMFNAYSFEALLDTYAEGIMFSIPALPAFGRVNSTLSGTGKVAMQECLSVLRDNHGPFKVIDVFGIERSRSIIVDDPLGNRMTLCAEVNEAGLVSNVFAFWITNGLGTRGCRTVCADRRP